jgi:D-3-phosphoglycerate dehydrogenase
MKILVAEPLAAAGIELLKAQPGWDVVVSNPKEYAQHLADADALLVRSAVKVNARAWAWITSIFPPPRPRASW